MRILHTSDWHLGRSFHRDGMLGHQAAYVDHLLEVVATEHVDLVVVAGDVYDRALPHVDAVALADDALARLAASRARVVLTSGNHDSALRLGFSSRLIDAAGVHIRTDLGGVGTPVVVEDAHGPVAVYGLPYLDPVSVHPVWRLPERSHAAALGEAMSRVRADLATRPGTRSVVLAHAFVAGGVASDSERDISVGGVHLVSADVFDGIDYVALGHLHGRQVVAERVRYSGSPLAYSFSEAVHAKGSWLVDLEAPGSVSADFVPAPVPRALARISGTLEDLLSDPTLVHAEDAWVQATLTDDLMPSQAMERLRRRFPHALELVRPSSARLQGVRSAVTVTERPGHEIAADFVAELRGTPATQAERSLLVRAFDACSHDAEADPRPADDPTLWEVDA